MCVCVCGGGGGVFCEGKPGVQDLKERPHVFEAGEQVYHCRQWEALCDGVTGPVFSLPLGVL